MHFSFRGKEHTRKYHPDDISSCKAESICACTGILFFLPLVSMPDSRFGRYWANQGLLILFFELACLGIWAIISWILGFLIAIKFIGIIFAAIKFAAAAVLILANAIYVFLPMSFAIRGRAVDIPFFGFMRFIK